ncbi:hypothetical protein DR864_15585 [Runella rosea]|uniref:Uncharacterized protein n=1 Tax=Runella rosea TaxID=2259595 RepID=A0A344TK99_9BACT|nr:hypothetical protein [Runella rosea]AXE19070.1 hypothetical protein DR864_15585 [Runella rosea]
MKKTLIEDEIIADNTKMISGNTENSTDALFSDAIVPEKTPEESKIKSDVAHTSEEESIDYSKSKNMSGNRGYNEVPHTVPIKK